MINIPLIHLANVLHWRGRGHANNSSSFHWLLLLGKPADFDTYDGNNTNEFFKQDFLVSSRRAKAEYLVIQFIHFRKTTGMQLENVDISEIVGIAEQDVRNLENDIENFRVGMDHQSVFHFPGYYHNPKLAHVGFLKEYAVFVLSEKIAIAGGSDESGVDIKRRYGRMPLKEASHHPREPIARYNSRHGSWHIFEKTTGEMMRVSFSDNESLERMRFLPASMANDYPDLVDMSLSDYCPVGCKECYQGSTRKGRHGDFKYICRCLAAMSGKVFEVAFGGGEPTLHPDFPAIMTYARNLGLTPNFTTRHYGWMDDKKKRLPILEAVGGFAVSVSDSNDIEKLVNRLEKYGIPFDKHMGGRVSVQVVMGTIHPETFRMLMDTAGKHNLPVTLLGYKHTGRAKATIPIEYSRWYDAVRASDCFEVGVDTVLAAQFPEIMAKLPAWMYEASDGKRSCYIHAGKQRMYRSSYVIGDEGVEMPLDNDDLLQHDFTLAWQAVRED